MKSTLRNSSQRVHVVLKLDVKVLRVHGVIYRTCWTVLRILFGLFILLVLHEDSLCFEGRVVELESKATVTPQWLHSTFCFSTICGVAIRHSEVALEAWE